MCRAARSLTPASAATGASTSSARLRSWYSLSRSLARLAVTGTNAPREYRWSGTVPDTAEIVSHRTIALVGLRTRSLTSRLAALAPRRWRVRPAPQARSTVRRGGGLPDHDYQWGAPRRQRTAAGGQGNWGWTSGQYESHQRVIRLIGFPWARARWLACPCRESSCFRSSESKLTAGNGMKLPRAAESRFRDPLSRP